MIKLPIDSEYLKIPKELVDKIHHEDRYIKSGTGKRAIRKIFYGVKYDNFEQEHIQQLQNLIKSKKVIFPQSIIEEDQLLRYLYSGDFDIEKAYKILTSHYEWLSDEKNFIIGAKTKEYLANGAVYIAGRDKKYRPVIIINIKMLYGSDFELPAFLNALYAIFNICREVIFVPGKIENWILVIETNEQSMISFPYSTLGTIISTASLQYSGTMEKIYITNPSTSLNICWSIIEKFMDDRTLTKINRLKKNDYGKMLEYISADQLEMKYGGTMDNITKYWPPLDTLKHLKEIREKNRTNSFHEKIDPSPISMRETNRKRIFDDSSIERSASPFLIKDDIDEIIQYRKSKNAPLTKDLYEDFTRYSAKRSMITKNSTRMKVFKTANTENIEEDQSLKSLLTKEKKESNGISKRESSYCGLCFTDRKANELNGKEEKSRSNISVCSIF